MKSIYIVYNTLKTHTKYAHIVRGRPTLKDIERFIHHVCRRDRELSRIPKKDLNKRTFNFNCRERIRQSIRKVKCRASRYLTLFSCNKLMCSCKSEAHIANYCNSKLSRDVEKNPGPPIYFDPNKTIAVP